jgi:hypothetical protein
MTVAKIGKKYHSDGNNPKAVKGGKFPVLQLVDDDGNEVGRIVGRAGQSYDDLIKHAQERGEV